MSSGSWTAMLSLKTFPGLEESNLQDIALKCRTLNDTLNKANVPLGIAYVAIDLFYLLLYIPCIIGILNPSNFKLSCYKIMAVMGAIDIATLLVGIIAGYFSIVGASACTCPTLMTICGSCVMGFWSTYCGICIYLGINRCGDVYGAAFMEAIFKGYRTWLFMVIPIGFGLCVLLFGPTMYYSSDLGTWFFELDPTSQLEGSLLHLLINIISVTVILAQYALIITKLYMTTRYQGKGKKLSPAARNVLVQTFIISIPLLLASTMFILIQFVPTPPAFTIVLQITWQSCHGGMAVIYLVFNGSLRIKFLESACCFKYGDSRVFVLSAGRKGRLGETTTRAAGHKQ